MMMTVGEAAAVERLDTAALYEYLDRIRAGCNDKPPELVGLLDNSTDSCVLRWQAMATRVMSLERRHSKDVFDTLRAVATAMTTIEGPKSVVVVSEGIVNDMGTTDELRVLAAAAERARVTLYGLALSKPMAEASGQLAMATAHARDQELLFDGLATVAIAARGAAYMVTGSAATLVARIDTEMSGYYLLSFARDDLDRDGQRQSIAVNVNWPGAVVRARKEFTIDRGISFDGPEPTGPPADLRGAIGSLLRGPVGVIEMGVAVDAYATAASGKAGAVKTLVAASFATGRRVLAAVGYEITDAVGNVVADGFEPSAAGAAAREVTTEKLPGDRQLYTTAVLLAPGRYRLKVAAIDDRGRRGSLEHAFDVTTGRLGSLHVGDLIVGDLSTGHFVPSPSILPGTPQLPVTVEVSADAADVLEGARITLELGRPGEPVFATLPLSLKPGTDDLHRIASATLAIGTLPAGEYAVSAVLYAADGGTLRRSRVFVKR
jgi:hypothetical protein